MPVRLTRPSTAICGHCRRPLRIVLRPGTIVFGRQIHTRSKRMRGAVLPCRCPIRRGRYNSCKK
jgi:hypothetical protein